MSFYKWGEAIEQRGKAHLFLLVMGRIEANSAVHAGDLGLLGKTVLYMALFDKLQFCVNWLLYLMRLDAAII